MKKEEVKMVRIYNPFLDAYCKIPLELAEKFLQEAEELKLRIKEAKKNDK
jgi:hypothetical protein